MKKEKLSLRAELLKKRRSITPEENRAAGERALLLLKNANLISPSSIVAAYWPMVDELDIHPILHWLHANNIPCALPCIVARDAPLLFRRFREGDALVNRPPFKILQPDDAAPILTPTIALMPLVGFDRHGNRIGMGGGFYDRTFAAHRCTLLGVGFAACEVAAIPAEPHDLHMQAILTEKELIQVRP